ncbi:MAG: hypothetical protein JW829_07320 [Pirellulales bacterium]|nr:hypothetical protein [Pirellulales bacterium]
MNELLTYLVSRLSFLYNQYGARFVDSQVRGPHASIVLEAYELRLRLVRDRSQIFVDFQSSENPSEDDWFSFDMIRQLLTGEIVDSAEMDDEKAQFIDDHFREIVDAFIPSRRKETEGKLHEYEHARAERLFS